MARKSFPAIVVVSWVAMVGLALGLTAGSTKAEDAEILYAPWAEVIKAPELPRYEDDDGATDGDEDAEEPDPR